VWRITAPQSDSKKRALDQIDEMAKQLGMQPGASGVNADFCLRLVPNPPPSIPIQTILNQMAATTATATMLTAAMMSTTMKKTKQQKCRWSSNEAPEKLNAE
jgi:hypothetical protein